MIKQDKNNTKIVSTTKKVTKEKKKAETKTVTATPAKKKTKVTTTKKTAAKVDKMTLLKDIMSSLENKYGHSIISDNTDQLKHIYSTGSYAIDKDTGIGGVPSGRIIEIYGPNASGKTTMALQIAANVQKTGKIAVYIDSENALDINYAKNLGVNLETMKRLQPTSGNQALEVVMDLLKHDVGVIVIDSVAALAPLEEMSNQGEESLGLHARMWSRYLRKINTYLADSDCLIILLNQVRQKINMGFSFGDTETTTGGFSIPHYASLRFRVKATTAIKQGLGTIGQSVNVLIKKNRFSMPDRIEKATAIYNGIGFCQSHEMLILGTKNDTDLTQQGNYYYWKNEKLELGFENTRQKIRNDPELRKEIYEHLRALKLL